METPHDLAKWLEGKMTDSERGAFEQSPDFKTYQKIRDYSAQLSPPVFNTDKRYNEIARGKKSKPEITIKPNWFLRIAALLVIALGLFYALGPMNTTVEMAENGKQQTFSLPDASKVTLNSGSKIEYHKWHWSKNRHLKLEGEAFFKVSKGSTFDVKTALGTVTVVGTQFNVRARGQRFEVICFEGKVKVKQNDKVLFLTPGQRAIFDNGVLIPSAFVADSLPSWMNFQLTFQAESLESIAAELERQYGLKITLKNVDTSRKFTGTIPAADLEMALQVIASAYEIEFKKDTPNAVVFYR